MPFAPEGQVWSVGLADPDLGQVRISGCLRRVPDASACVLLVHGLGGRTGSYYTLRGAGAVAQSGMDSLALSLRGSDREGEDFYNIALFADLVAACASPELAGYERIYILGYSMGGYVSMHFALNVEDPRVKAVAVQCTPIDLKAAQVYIDSTRAWLYRRHCLDGLKSIYDAVARLNPERVPTANEDVQGVRSMWDWDALAIAPRYGYGSPEEYYDALSLRRDLGSFRVPTLLVAAEHDPIVPAHTIRPFLDSARKPIGCALQVKWIRDAGHVTFPNELDLGFGPKKGIEPQLLHWFRQQ